MPDKTLKYPPGTAITFTTGCYSDFSTRGTLITLKEVDLAACAGQERGSAAACRAGKPSIALV